MISCGLLLTGFSELHMYRGVQKTGAGHIMVNLIRGVSIKRRLSDAVLLSRVMNSSVSSRR